MIGMAAMVPFGAILNGCENQTGPQTSQDVLTGTISITGDVNVGETLTADTTGITNGSGTASYQWKRTDDNGIVENIAGATGATYTLTEDDLGWQISVTITFSGNSGSITSTWITDKVKPALDALTGTVSITGTPKVGEELTVTISNSNGTGGKETYQWKRNGVNIAGATSATYTLVGADLGGQISVTVTFQGYSGSINSTQIVTVEPATPELEELTGTVSITGTLAPNYDVTANISGDTNGIGTATYQWKRDGVDIASANGSTYKLVMADGQKPITVEVRFPGYSGSITSDPVTPCYIMAAQIKIYQDAGVTDSQMTAAFNKLNNALTPWGGGGGQVLLAISKKYT
jgi:hypothetical protein